jgi:hypothetical protein
VNPWIIGAGVLLAVVLFGGARAWSKRRSSVGPQMVAWVTPSGIKSAYNAGNAFATLPLYSAASVKIADGSSGSENWRDRQNGPRTNGEWIDLFTSECRAAGVPISGHGFHYLLTVESARQEGARAAESALFHGVKAYSCNAEIHWLKGRMDYKGKDKPYAPTAHIRATGLAFLEGFKSVAPGIRCHLTPMMHMVSIWGPVMTPDWLSQWDGLERMIFATSSNTRRKRWSQTIELTNQAKAIKPSFSYVPLWPTGSVESGTSYAGAQLQAVELEAQQPTEYLGIYFGNYAGTMWATGNAYGPPWTQIIAALRGGVA